MSETAECRYCKVKMKGKPYCYGGPAYLVDGSRAKVNHYGGFICSELCDKRASLELERSMPGHDDKQMSLSCYASNALASNWG